MKFNRTTFWQQYRAEFEAKINQPTVEAIVILLDRFENHSLWTSLPSIAYAFATIKHETANTFAPITERGARSYFDKYENRKTLGNTQKGDGYKFRGRGFVQITGRHNYTKFSELLTMDLINKPELALDRDVAFNILSLGMTKGLFTGKKLSDYIDSKKYDFEEARRIINSTDKADLIAGYAAKFLHILRMSKLAYKPQSEPIDANVAPKDDWTGGSATVQPEPDATEPGATANAQVNIGDNSNTPKSIDEALPGTRPHDPPIQVTQNKTVGRIYGVLGGLSAAYTAVQGFVSGHDVLVVVGIVGVILIILALIFKGLITDYLRMKIFADPGKYNVK